MGSISTPRGLAFPTLLMHAHYSRACDPAPVLTTDDFLTYITMQDAANATNRRASVHDAAGAG